MECEFEFQEWKNRVQELSKMDLDNCDNQISNALKTAFENEMPAEIMAASLKEIKLKKIMQKLQLKMVNQKLANKGWSIDCEHLMNHVTDQGDVYELLNYHTHGFEEKFKSLDFQIVAPLPIDMVYELFDCIAEILESGKKIKNGEEIGDVFDKAKIKAVYAYETDRNVLRLILPDKNGNVSRDMDFPFSLQYLDLDPEYVP